MGKTLLQSLNEAKPGKTTLPAAKGAHENQGLSELMTEMKPHLEEASKDLLRPRKEALDKLLKKALH